MNYKEILEQAAKAIEEIESARKLLIKIQEQFDKLLVDKTIPLEERWQMYVDAPGELHGSYSDVCIYVSVLTDDIPDFSWAEETWAQRHQEIDFKYHVCEWVDEIKSGNFEGWKRAFEKDPTLLAKLQEQVLATNINTFIFDW